MAGPDGLQPGNFWKTPFLWEPDLPAPQTDSTLSFRDAPDDWLLAAVADVMSHSLDPSDRHAVSRHGAEQAARDLLALVPEHFVRPAGWWRVAEDAEGSRVAFVLLVRFKGRRSLRDGRPEATILYMGVLPAFRGNRYGRALLAEAARLCSQADCWRLFCDTGSDNLPMIRTFRQAGFAELEPWQRPLE